MRSLKKVFAVFIVLFILLSFPSNAFSTNNEALDITKEVFITYTGLNVLF